MDHTFDRPVMIKTIFWEMTDNLQDRLSNIDFLTYLTKDAMVILTIHLQTLKQSSYDSRNPPPKTPKRRIFKTNLDDADGCSVSKPSR